MKMEAYLNASASLVSWAMLLRVVPSLYLGYMDRPIASNGRASPKTSKSCSSSFLCQSTCQLYCSRPSIWLPRSVCTTIGHSGHALREPLMPAPMSCAKRIQLTSLSPPHQSWPLFSHKSCHHHGGGDDGCPSGDDGGGGRCGYNGGVEGAGDGGGRFQRIPLVTSLPICTASGGVSWSSSAFTMSRVKSWTVCLRSFISVRFCQAAGFH